MLQREKPDVLLANAPVLQAVHRDGVSASITGRAHRGAVGESRAKSVLRAFILAPVTMGLAHPAEAPSESICLVCMASCTLAGVSPNPQNARILCTKAVVKAEAGCPVVMNLPANAGDMDSIPGRGTKIPHASGQLSLCAITTEAHVPRALQL